MRGEIKRLPIFARSLQWGVNGPSPVFPVDAVASASILSLLFLLRSVSAYVRAPFLLPGGVQKVYPDLRPGKLFSSSFLRLSAKECCAFLLKCLAHMGWLALNIHLSYGALNIMHYYREATRLQAG